MQTNKKISNQVETLYDRGTQSIQEWVRDWTEAQDRRLGYQHILPRKKRLMDLYDMVMIDAKLSSAITNRKSKILGESFHVLDANGEIDDQKTKLLQKSWFTDSDNGFISHALDAKFYGYSLIGLEDVTPNGEIRSVRLIERRNTIPERNLVLRRPYEEHGIDFTQNGYQNRYILARGKEHGLLLKASVLVIYKRSLLGYWVEHAEVFSTPILIGKTDVDDAEKKDQMSSELSEGGRSRSVVIGIDDEIDVTNLSDSNAHMIYKEGVNEMDMQLSWLIQGQNGTSDVGTNYKEASNHKQTAEEIAEADREFIQNFVNDELFPRLSKLKHYGSFEGCTFEYVLDRKAPLTERIELFKYLSEYYDIEEDTIEEEFGVVVKKKSNPLTA